MPKNKKSYSVSEILSQFKLVWQLIRDPNVSSLVRFGLPLIGLIYLISPIDLLPDPILGLGQLDDVAVLLLLSQLLVSLAPDDLVNKYRQATGAEAGGPSPAARPGAADDEVIDTDYEVVS